MTRTPLKSKTSSADLLVPAPRRPARVMRSARALALIKQSRRSGVGSLVNFATEMAVAEPMDQVELEREGLPAAVVADLARSMAVSRVRMFEMMNLPRATMEKKISDDEVLTGVANRRALNLLRLLAHASEILKDSTAAEAEGFDVARWLGRWIETPQPALGGKRPADLLDTETGAGMVDRTLGAMRSGAYL
jgi:putative toxin-antitoxin system antitoxin component (TIGR02293 family)